MRTIAHRTAAVESRRFEKSPGPASVVLFPKPSPPRRNKLWPSLPARGEGQIEKPMTTTISHERVYLPATIIKSRYSGAEFPVAALTERHVALMRLALSRETPKYCGMITADEATPDELRVLTVRGFMTHWATPDFKATAGYAVASRGMEFLDEISSEAALLADEGSAA